MIQFDITSSEVLEYGYKYDIGTEQIEFSGFTKDDEANLVYLVFDNGQHYLIPLTDTFTIDVGSPLTDVYGKAQGQLVEMSTDGLFVKNSNIFEIYVKRSICRDETSDVSNTALSTLYAQLYVMYQQIVEQADQYATIDELEAEVGVAVEEYIAEHPVEAPVTSVNQQIGDVVLTAQDVNALPSNTQFVSSFNGQTGAITYDAPVASVNGKTGAVNLTATDVSALPSSTTIPTRTSQLTNDSGYITSAPVTSVNAKTGAVVLSASDVGALPSTTPIPSKTSDLTNDSGFLSTAVTSFNNQTGAVTYTAPVTSVNGMTGDVIVQGGGGSGAVASVNGKTGVVVLDADDVGALPDDTVIPTKTSDLTNDSNFVSDVNYVHTDNNFTTAEKNKLNGIESGAEVNAVNSVNGEVGDVTIAVPTKTSELQNDSGFLTAIPSEYVTDSELSTELATKAPIIINSASGDIVTLSDGADNLPFKSVAVNIEPSQSGSGDPSPDNVRPISGWTAVNIYQSGVDTSSPTVYPITLPTEAGTVYGGTIDVVKGTLTVTHGLYRVQSSTAIARQTGKSNYYFNVVIPGAASIDVFSGVVCNILKTAQFAQSVWGGAEDSCCIKSGNASFYVDDLKQATKEEALQWLVDNGCEICYPLGTPRTYTLSKTEIRTLFGSNTLWADAGAVDVQYPADTKLYIDGKIAELQALVLENA